MSLRYLPSNFGSIQVTVWEDMSFEEFQDGGHIGKWNGIIFNNPESLCRSDASY